MGRPIIAVRDGNYKNRGELFLEHQFNGVELKTSYALDTLVNLQRLWTRPVHIETVIDESVDRWLTMLERNRGTWLAAIGARGPGHDPELETIMEQAREQAADRLIEALQTYEAARPC